MPKHPIKQLGTILVLLLALPLTALAQRVETTDSVYVFTMVKELPHSPVKSQGRTGTCWCFATMSLLESEAMRNGAPQDLDLSEMFVVRHTYEQKAAAYVRWHGNLAFGQGSMMHLAIIQMDRYGLVPESVYDGRNIGLDTYHNGEIHTVLQNMLDGVLKARRPTPRWPEAVSVVLDTYLGASPESFEWNGKTVTPMAYRDALKLDPADYIEVTSIDRAPFYTQVLSEFPDNWDYNDDYYNLPVEEIPGLIEQALLNGYSVVYGGDISGPHFSTGKTGMGIVPVDSADFSQKEIVPEQVITQELRTKLFDDFTTSDDHAMHIVGIAQDQKGNKYYYTKNSHGVEGRAFGGYVYLSEAYVQLNMNSLLLNKKGLSKDTKKKLHLE